MPAHNNIYIFSNGRVAAIDKKNGEIVWEVKLKAYVKSSMSYSIGQIIQEGNKLLIGVAGIIICLSTKDGSLLWKNELKGWGYSFVSIASENASVAAAVEQANAAAMTAVTATTT